MEELPLVIKRAQKYERVEEYLKTMLNDRTDQTHTSENGRVLIEAGQGK